jgi:hypothetical protein
VSQYLHVLLAVVPSRDVWQAEIEKAGFDLTLDPKLLPETNRGYVDVRYGTAESAFELWISSASDGFPDYEQHAAELPPNLSLAAMFTWAPNDFEQQCGYIAAACLARQAGGIFYDPQEDRIYSGADAVARVKEWVDDPPK